MKPIYFLPFLSLLLLAPASGNAAGSMLRIACEGDNVGAEISINGTFKGECPLDMQVREGTVKLRVQKKLDAQHERVFEQEFRVGDGVVKKIEVKLGAPQLNAEGRRLDERLVLGVRNAAEGGDSKAMMDLANRYSKGEGVPYSPEQSAQWLSKAAAAGDIKAMLTLGKKNSYSSNVSRQQESIRWFRRAAEAGSAEGMVGLGGCYALGTGVEKNYAEAVQWYRKAAELGNGLAMYYIAENYNRGLSVEKNDAQAVAWLRKSAQAGHTDAMYELGLAYYRGLNGLAQDKQQAFTWFLAAAEKGHANGMYTVGTFYSGGGTVQQDEQKAVAWFRKAAEANQGGAIKELQKRGLR